MTSEGAASWAATAAVWKAAGGATTNPDGGVGDRERGTLAIDDEFVFRLARMHLLHTTLSLEYDAGV